MPSPAATARPAAPHSIAYNLALIGVVAACAAVALAYCIDAIGRLADAPSPLTTPSVVLEKNVAGQKLVVPEVWIRYADQRKADFLERLDLRIPLQLEATAHPVEIDATLVPHSRVRSSAQLLDTVYLHMFEPGQLSGPLGLVGKPLRQSEGFQNETVWYDPLSVAPFTAKCISPLEGEAAGNCIRTLALKGTVALVLSFDQRLLAHWREFDAALAAPLKTLGVTLAP